jgi:hypothetical protein
MKKQLFYTHLLSGLFATAILCHQPLQAQWSAPVIYGSSTFVVGKGF